MIEYQSMFEGTFTYFRNRGDVVYRKRKYEDMSYETVGNAYCFEGRGDRYGTSS